MIRRLMMWMLVCCVLIVGACGEQVVVRETQASCGNSTLENGEACDDGNDNNSDRCTNACELAVCGDGVSRTDLQPGDEGYEVCDDGNDIDEDFCTNSCIPAQCGDGILRTDLRGQ